MDGLSGGTRRRVSPNVTPPVTCPARKQQLVLFHLAVSTGSLSFSGWHGGVQQVRQTAPVASNAPVMPAGFHSSVGDPGNRRSPWAPELVEGHLKEVGRCDIFQPCQVGALGADGAVLVGPHSVLEVTAKGEPRTWPGWGRLKRCLHLLLLLFWLDLLLLLLLCAAGLLGRSLHLLLLQLLLLHWQWGEEHLLHLPHWKSAAHWGAQGRRATGQQHGRQLL